MHCWQCTGEPGKLLCRLDLLLTVLLLTVLHLINGLLGELSGNSNEVSWGQGVNLLEPLGILSGENCISGSSCSKSARLGQGNCTIMLCTALGLLQASRQ